MMDAKTQHGYLVIADISGFTSYLAKVELEHAHEILTDLLETIVKEFKTLLTISKLEGDAVFAYVPEANTPGGEKSSSSLKKRMLHFAGNGRLPGVTPPAPATPANPFPH